MMWGQRVHTYTWGAFPLAGAGRLLRLGGLETVQHSPAQLRLALPPQTVPLW